LLASYRHARRTPLRDTGAPAADRLTVQALRQAIIDVLYGVKAYNLADDCVSFGLESAGEHDSSTH
jgi:hypothetical protein